MKVIQMTTFFYPSVGGVEKQAEDIAINLTNRGFEVKVFTTNASHGTGKQMQRLSDIFEQIPVYRFRVRLRLGYFFRLAPMLLWRLLREDYDLIHAHNVHDAHLLPAILIAKLRRKKIVLTGHNPFIVGAEKRGKTLNFFVGFYDLVFKFFAPGINRYIALLESEKQEVMRKFGWRDKKVVVIPNGINDRFYSNKEVPGFDIWQELGVVPDKWSLIVGTASRINFVKGLQNLKLAVDKLPRVLFIFVGGDGGYLQQIKNLYSGNKNVIITGKYMDPDKVRYFYVNIDLFLLPSVYEPFGMTIVEAMTQGTPVLATSKGGPPEIVSQTAGEILDPSDQELWMQRIKYYSKTPAELDTFSPKEAAKQYSWDNVIERIIKVYQSV